MNKLMTNYSIEENSSRGLFRDRTVLAQSAVFLLLLVNAFRANTIPDIAILAVAMILPFFLRPKEITAYIVGFSMMGTGIQVAYISLSCLVSLAVRSKNKIKVITLVSILGIICYELLHLSMVHDDTIEFFRYAIVYAVLFYILFMDYDVQDKIRIVSGFIYGTVCSILHIFIETFNVVNGNVLKFIDGSLRFGYAEQLGVKLTMSADPNSVGQGCTIIIVASLMLIMLGYKHKKYYVSMFIALLAGTLTISKTFFISLILIVVFMILFVGSWTSSKMMGRRIALILLVMLGCFVVLKVNPTYIENVFSRVDASDITTGRVANAMTYLEYLMDDVFHLLFGVGMQNVGEKIGFTGSPHAAIIVALICWGIIGTVFMLALILKAILHHTANVKTRMLNYVPLFIFTIIVQSTQLFRLRDRVFALVVVILLTGIPQRGGGENAYQEKGIVSH